MQQSRLSRLPRPQVALLPTRKYCISNSRSTRKSRLQPNGPLISYSWRQPWQVMPGTCRTLFSTRSKVSTPTFPTKGCGDHRIRPLRNKIWPWLPNSNKPNPKVQVNNFIHAAVKTLKAASTSGGTITDQEILYFQFKIYKKIKAPAKWTSHILFLEATVASNAGYLLDTLFNEVQSKYTNLSNQGLWRPSDKTPEEQTLAMVAQQQQTKPKSSSSSKKESSSKSSSKDKDKEKEKKGPHSHKRKVNWVTQNSGMARHITTVPPTTNTAIGIPIRLKNVTLTRR